MTIVSDPQKDYYDQKIVPKLPEAEKIVLTAKPTWDYSSAHAKKLAA